MADDETPRQYDDGVTRPDQGVSASSATEDRPDAEPPAPRAPAEDTASATVPSAVVTPTGSSPGFERPGSGWSTSDGTRPESASSESASSESTPAGGAEPDAGPAAGDRGGAGLNGAGAGGVASSSPWARPGSQPAPGEQPVPSGASTSGSAAPPPAGGYQQTQYPPYPTAPVEQGAAPYPGTAPAAGTGGGFQLFGQPAEAYPRPGGPQVDTGQPPGVAIRRKVVLAGVALTLVAALVGGGLGGLFGYRLAVNGGRLGAASAAESQAAVEQVAGRVLPSVVQIRVTSGQQSGAGSGMVLRQDGLVLTNNHVVDTIANGGQMSVLLYDGRSVPGKIVARDPGSDIALVQLQNVTGLPPVTLGDSASVRIGQTVVAVGSPLGLGGTVTSGIVSALDRAVEVSPDQDEPNLPPGLNLPPGFTLPPGLGAPGPYVPPPAAQAGSRSPEVLDAIQTDAAINPGNSGGPLVDLDGDVIGINTAIASLGGSGDQNGSVGLGFSIPIDQAKRIVQQLRTTGHATKALLGVNVQGGSRLQSPDKPVGAVVKDVAPGGAAEKAGVKKGDVIVKVDGRPITYGDDLVAAIRADTPGAPVTLTLSDGRTVKVVLGEGPSTDPN
jgi:putative serine protease PepD